MILPPNCRFNHPENLSRLRFSLQADWTMPIDYQNDQGVTILHVAAQNGNKRIAKLCLRRGADVNRPNHNGQVNKSSPILFSYLILRYMFCLPTSIGRLGYDNWDRQDGTNKRRIIEISKFRPRSIKWRNENTSTVVSPRESRNTKTILLKLTNIASCGIFSKI